LYTAFAEPLSHDQTAPFHPSRPESCMCSVQLAPGSTETVRVEAAAPSSISGTPPHTRSQLISELSGQLVTMMVAVKAFAVGAAVVGPPVGAVVVGDAAVGDAVGGAAREPQSVQSVPSSQSLVSDPGPPSSQYPSLA
jgi:hypothetical protein